MPAISTATTGLENFEPLAAVMHINKTPITPQVIMIYDGALNLLYTLKIVLYIDIYMMNGT